MAAVRVGHELLARRRGSLGKARIEQARHLVGLRPRPKTEFWVNVTDEVVSRLGYRTSPTTHPHARDATQAESTLADAAFSVWEDSHTNVKIDRSPSRISAAGGTRCDTAADELNSRLTHGRVGCHVVHFYTWLQGTHHGSLP